MIYLKSDYKTVKSIFYRLSENKNTRFVKITAEGIYLTPSDLIPWKQTNLPAHSFQIKQSIVVVWEVLVTSLDIGKISLQIIDYDSNSLHHFRQQKMKRKVDFIKLELMDWPSFERMLAVYEIIALKPYFSIKNEHAGEITWNRIPEINKNIHLKLTDESVQEKVNCSIPYEEMDYREGYICFTYYYPELDVKLEIKIHNPWVYPSMQLVKYYFPRVFKKKQAAVTILLNIQKGQIISYEAHSPDLDKIKKQTTEVIRDIRIAELSEPFTHRSPLNIFHDQNIWDMINQELNRPSPDPIQIQDILKFWLEKKEVRNKRQLAFLSGHLQSPQEKIHITLNPDFGFLFVIEGDQMKHFCWELLDSNASYLWSFDKEKFSTADCLQLLTPIIGVIKARGRNFYRQEMKVNPSPDYLFSAIHHEAEDITRIDGFRIWKERLESKLI